MVDLRMTYLSGAVAVSYEGRACELRRQAVDVAREQGRLADVRGVHESRHPALQPQRAAAVRRHPVAEGVQVAPERLLGEPALGQGRLVLRVAVEPLAAGHQLQP